MGTVVFYLAYVLVTLAVASWMFAIVFWDELD